MKKSEWINFRNVIDNYRAGRITRADFCLFWAMAQKYMDVDAQ